MFSSLLATAAIMLVLDTVWLSANAAYHRKVFAALQGAPLQVRWIPAVAVYAIMIAAVWYLAVLPATSVGDAAGRGAVLGAAMYGVYDLTNYATLSKYPLSYALSDLAWGILLCTATATIAFYAAEPKSNGLL
jgi:uncharacterized membrane protein